MLKFFSVKRASLNYPPASLVNKIMERQNVSRPVPSIQWGIINESITKEAYLDIANREHENFSFMPAGLHVNPFHPTLEPPLMDSLPVIVVGKVW